MIPTRLENLAQQVIEGCRAGRLSLATAESCTGGLIIGCLTEIAGASAVVDRGFVTYSNAAKDEMLGVSAATLRRHGAVSEATARAMAEAALERSGATLAVAVTGIAGPGGGTAEKPVGLVHIATAVSLGETRHQRLRYGDLGRAEIRWATVETALQMLLERVAGPGPG